MRGILAVDIGKTKTISLVLDQSLNIIGYHVTGPADITLDKNIIIKNLRNAIEKCLSLSQIRLDKLDIIVISWSGLDTKEDYEQARKYLKDLNLSYDKVHIIHDALSAFYAVTWGNPGIAVIAGTGSIAYGMNEEGITARSSGWGWLFGDEGSSSWIALQALNAASRAYDGRGEYTTLTERIKEYFKVQDLIDILPIIYRGKLYTDISIIAKLAIIVDEEAKKGDIVSRKILEKAGYELALTAYSVAKKLGIENSKNIIVGGVGSVFKSSIVKETFVKNIRSLLPNAKIKEPIIGYQAVLGSIIYALRNLKIEINENTIYKLIRSLDKAIT